LRSFDSVVFRIDSIPSKNNKTAPNAKKFYSRREALTSLRKGFTEDERALCAGKIMRRPARPAHLQVDGSATLWSLEYHYEFSA
jgi:hypothetical protein